jgi:hypothetical protein
MAGRTSLAVLSEAEYSGLVAALSMNAKGRMFLAEYVRRSRPEDTNSLIGALQRIEGAIEGARGEIAPERIAAELRQVAFMLAIASEDAAPLDEEMRRRLALVDRARLDLEALAGAFDGKAGADEGEERRPAGHPLAAMRPDPASAAAEAPPDR